jgi:hypothetical protein
MPTVQQLPPATLVNPTDEVMLSQSGSSVSATIAQLVGANAPSITLTGDVTGSGTGNVAISLVPVGTPGTYAKVTVNTKGQVTAGGPLAASDVESALGFTPYSSSNPAGYLTPGGLAPVATEGSYASLTGTPALGSVAAQNANAVAITGGAISGVNLSSNLITASGATTARSFAARAGDVVNVLDYGADPTGAADSAPAFTAAMNAVPLGGHGSVFVPNGTYRLGSFVNEPSNRRITLTFADGATVTGNGMGVERVESTQGAYTLRQGGGGWFGFSPTLIEQSNLAFHTDILQNTAGNSGAMRVGWARNYANYNYYGKYVSGIDIAEQNIFTWPFLYDNSSGWGHWEVINGPTWDEDSATRAHISASAEHSEFDVVSNAPEAGWIAEAGLGQTVQGMSINPWGQNGNYGGNLLFAYGSAGSFDGAGGGLNQRWPSYPAVFSAGNPAAVAQNSTIVVTFDLTAHATASISASGGVSAVAVSNGGGAYASAPVVQFSGGGGTGATAQAVMLGGAVVGVTVTFPGAGYISAPTVSFSGGGVASATPVTVTLNTDGAHGDLASIAASINAAGIPNLRAAVASWGGVVGRLVVFGTASNDLGTLTLGGSALGTLGIAAGATSTTRDTTAVVFGGTGGVAPGDKLIVNGKTVVVAGTGALTDVVAAINGAEIAGVTADITANGALVLTAWLPASPGGLVLAQVPGYTTLNKLSLNAGTFWPPTPPKGFATAYGELSSPVCPITDQISITATDLLGTSYGPVVVTLNGGSGSGWPLDVAASIQTALSAAGWYNNSAGNMLSAPPAILTATTHGFGGTQGVVIRNTAGGTLTLANVTGTPLQILGIAPGTYQPGGYAAGSQSVFLAAEDSIGPQGRGIFLGGASTATDRTVWPHAPAEARGNFLHGLRTDKATFDDNNALLIGAGQAIAFGIGSGALSLTNAGGTLAANGAPVALSSSVPSRISQLTNDAGYLGAAAIPPGAGQLLGATGAAGAAAGVTVGANLVLAKGTLAGTGVASFNARAGAVSLTAADVTAALGFTPGTGGVASVVAGPGLAGGTITTTGSISLAALAPGSLLGNAGAATAVPAAIAIGPGITLSASGTLGNGGVVSFNGRPGAVALASGDITSALGYTPANRLGDVFTGPVTLNEGGSFLGTLTNTGTLSGGVVMPATLAVGSAAVEITTTATTDSGGNALIDNSVGGTTPGQIAWRLSSKSGYVQFGDWSYVVPNAAGAEAIDLQLDRANANQIASGNRAVALGAQNVSSGARAVAIGYGNTASGQGSVVLGQKATDNGTMGAMIFSAGFAGQSAEFQLGGMSGVGTPVRLTADGNPAGATNVINLPLNSGLGGVLTLTARNLFTGDVALWSVSVLAKNAGGTIVVTSPAATGLAPTATDSSLAAATVSIAADTLNGGLNIAVTPPANVAVHASAVLRASQIT